MLVLRLQRSVRQEQTSSPLVAGVQVARVLLQQDLCVTAGQYVMLYVVLNVNLQHNNKGSNGKISLGLLKGEINR